MKNTTLTPAEVAANFHVAELEPRLENSWTNMSGTGPDVTPSGGDGQGGNGDGA